LPPGSANFNTQGVFGLNTDSSAINANSPNTDPQKATNLELGTKWNILDNKLALTAAVFKSTNDNEIVNQPESTSLPIGKRQVEGIEFGIAGILTQNWQISAGLAFMDAEILRGSVGSNANASNADGAAIQWSPDVTFTLWNTYTFDNGLMVGGGARYIDSMVSTSITDPARLATRSLVNIPDYWVFDAMASYPINKNLNVQLNIYNLADEDYIASVNNAGSRYFPGTPLSARLGVNFAF
jgi:catecholate siderophore receptor